MINRTNNYTTLYFLLLLIGCMVPLTFIKVYEPDLFLHLKIGELIINGHFPKNDPFTYIAEGTPWVPSEWLSQVIFYLFYARGGFKFLEIFTSLVVLIVFLLFFLLILRKSNVYLAFFFAFITFFLTMNRIQPRPHIFSYLFFVVILYILKNRRKRLFFLPLLFLLWSNFHPEFIMGIAFLFLTVANEAIVILLESKGYLQPTAGRTDASKKEYSLFVMLILSFLASFLTPAFPHNFTDGINFASFLKENIDLSENSASIAELMPVTINGFMPFIIIAFIAICFIILNLKQTRNGILPVILFLLFALRFRRWIPEFCFITFPVAAESISYYFKKTSVFERYKKALVPGLLGIFLITSAAVVYNRYSNDYFNRMGFGLNEEFYPKDAMTFIRENRIKGEMFNSVNFGGGLIHYFYPERKVLQDTRFLSHTILKKIEDGYMDDAIKSRIERISYAIVRANSLGRLYPSVLLKKDSWAVVWWDDIAVVLLKRIPENDKIIKQLEFFYVTPLNILSFADNIFNKNPDKALFNEIERAGKLSSNNSMALYAMAIYLMAFDTSPEALWIAENNLRNALRISPWLAQAHYRLAECLERQGRIPEALDQVKRAKEVFRKVSGTVPEFVIKKEEDIINSLGKI